MIRTRRLVTFLLGVWLGGSVAIIWVKAQNLRSVNRLAGLHTGLASELVETLGQEPAANFMRYQAAEMNRVLSLGWGYAQPVLGLTVFLILLFGTTAGRTTLLLSLLMFVVTLVVAFPQGAAYETIYSTLEGIKILLGVVLTAMYLFARERRKRSAREIDAVDHPNHRHVNR